MNASTHEEALFRAAVQLDTAQRTAFLDRECAGDPALRKRLEALLAAHDQPDTEFGTGVSAPRPTISLDLAHELADDLVGETIGRYKLLEQIGEGGCGVVYVAEQTEPVRRRVALKIIKLGMDTKQVVARFEAERQALAMMDHPNIAKVLDAGTTEGGSPKSEIRNPKEIRSPKSEVSLAHPGPADASAAGRVAGSPRPSDGRGVGGEGGPIPASPPRPLAVSPFRTPAGRPYFVMELVRGIRITDYCDQEQRSTRDRLDLFIKVCHAVQHAHQKGIIHRDIKPSNILVTLHDGVPVPKVIDFGIAKAVEGRLTDATVYTQLHQFIGTPAYMSPEQAEMSGLDIDTRSDIYSLGVLLYELLTGVTPFDAKELMSQGVDAMRRTIREQEPVRPSTRLTQELAIQVGRAAPRAPVSLAGGLPDGARGATRPSWRQEEVSADSRRRLRLKETIALLRGDLDCIVMKCLEKERTRRYDNASALAQDVQRHLDNRPIQARPATTVARVRKWMKRRPAAAALVGMGWLTLLAMFGAGATRLALQTERRLRAEIERRQQTEAELRDKVETALARTERAFYSRNVTVAQRDWEENNVARARQVLDECNPELRRWEWDYLRGLCEADLLTVTHHSGVRSVAFSPRGLTLASGTADGTVRLTSVETGQALFTVSLSSAGIGGLAFAPDGALLVAADQTNLVILDAATGSRVRTIAAHASPIEAVAWSPDGNLLASGGRGPSVRVWNAATGELGKELYGHRSVIRSVAFSVDSTRLVTAASRYRTREIGTTRNQSGEAFLWDLRSGVPIHRLPVESSNPSPTAGFLSVAQDPIGHLIAAGRTDGVLELWRSANGLSVNPFPKAGLTEVSGVAFLPPERVVSVGTDTAVRVWSLKDANETVRFQGHDEAVNAVAVSPNGRFIASGSEDKTLKLWDVNRSQEPFLIEASGVTVRFSPDGRLLAVVGRDGCRVWSLEAGQPVLDQASGAANSYEPRGLAFSPDGRDLAASSGTEVLIWRTGDWQLKHRLQGENRTFYAIAYSPDGTLIATGDGPFTGEVILWDADTGGEIRRLVGNSNAVWSVAFSPDGKTLASASGGYGYWGGRKPSAVEGPGPKKRGLAEPGEISVWDVDSGAVRHTLRGHQHCIWDVAFSPDGAFLASVASQYSRSDRAEIHVWSVASGTRIATLDLDGGHAFSLSFSPDGSRLAVGHGRQHTGLPPTVALWDWRGKEELLSLDGPTDRIIGVSHNRDGNYLAACGPNGVWIWDANRNSEQAKRRRRAALLRDEP